MLAHSEISLEGHCCGHWGATSFTNQRSDSLGMDRVLTRFHDLEMDAVLIGFYLGPANTDGKEGLINPDSMAVLGLCGTLEFVDTRACVSEAGVGWGPC